MVHGSGSHHRSNGRRDGSSTRNGGGNNARREATSARATPTTTMPGRRGDGGGGLRSTTTNDSRGRETTTARQSSSSSRPNHGSGTRTTVLASSSTPSTPTPTQTQTSDRKHNHGSGTRRVAPVTSTSTARNAATTSKSWERSARSPAANTRATTSSSNSRRTVSVSATPTTQTTPNTVRTTTNTTSNVRHNHGSGTHRDYRPSPSSSSSRRDAPAASFGAAATRTATARHHLPNLRSNYSSDGFRRSDPSSDNNYYENERDLSNGCLCCLCGYFCSFVGAVLGIFFAVLGAILCCLPCRRRRAPGDGDDNEDTAAVSSARRNNSNNSKLAWWIPAVGLLLSSVVCASLVSLTSVEGNNLSVVNGRDDGGDDVWTLVPGETHRVYLPRLVRGVRVTVTGVSDLDVRAAVFKLAKCPPLSGPQVTVQHDSAFDLPGGGFEYDYYNLYPGSTVDVRFTQLAGSTYFYLLKGIDALRDIQTGRNTDPDHWESIAVAKRFVTPTTSTSNNDVHYKLRGADNDIYTLVYDNASMQRDSSLDVESDLVMSTYDLAGYTPRCDNMMWRGAGGNGDSCRLSATRDDCVVLEAFSTSGNHDGDRVILLRVEAWGQWMTIGGWSVVPLMLSCVACALHWLVVLCCCKGSTRAGGDMNDGDDAAAAEPLLSEVGRNGSDGEYQLPPPMAPLEDQLMPPPTAPLEEPATAPSVIVIPPEDVTTLPTEPEWTKQ